MAKTYCYDHAIYYSGNECPRCRGDEVAREQCQLLEQIAATAASAGNSSEMRDAIQEAISNAVHKLRRPGAYQCPECAQFSLNGGAKVCFMCRSKIDPSFWDELAAKEKEYQELLARKKQEKKIEEEKAEHQKEVEAEESARRLQKEAEESARRLKAEKDQRTGVVLLILFFVLFLLFLFALGLLIYSVATSVISFVGGLF